MFTDFVVWLCQSPRRLAVGAVTVLTVLLIGGSAIFGRVGGGAPVSSTGTAAASTTTAAGQVPDANPYITAAVAFVRIWSQLKPGETAAQWQASLAPFSTSELGQALRTTNPTRLPGVPPSGEPVVRYLAQTSALIAVALSDGSSVLVTLVSGDTRPLVSDIQPDAGN